MVAVDVKQGEQVTFDSHSYGVDFAYDKEGNKHVHMVFNKGLMPEHVMASASVPVHYDYALVPITIIITNLSQKENLKQ